METGIGHLLINNCSVTLEVYQTLFQQDGDAGPQITVLWGFGAQSSKMCAHATTRIHVARALGDSLLQLS